MSVFESVFAEYRNKSYPYTYLGRLRVPLLVGGIPSDDNVAKGWIETKLKGTLSQERLERLVTETMVDRGITFDEAVDEVNRRKNLNGFKRGNDNDPDHKGELYIEGRQLKAALKEAVSVAVAAKKLDMRNWGATRKFLTNYFPEHVFVLDDKLWLGVVEPSGVFQNFVHTHKGSSVQYQEYVTDVDIDFTVISDHPFSKKQWGMIWTTGEQNGLGASRSQGYGTYRVTRWDLEVSRGAEDPEDMVEGTIVAADITGDPTSAPADLVVTTRRKR